MARGNQVTYSGINLFGEVLYDCFPDGNNVLGGAPFNVAWHCQAFGLNPLFISRVGDDSMGQEIVSAMNAWGMRTDGIQIDPSNRTGKVNVSFLNGEPSYDIVENSAWDYIDFKDIPKIESTSILYHGSLAARNTISAETLISLKQQSSFSIFVDVNLRPPWWQLSSICHLLHGARWIKLNLHELTLLVQDSKVLEDMALRLMTKYGAELVIVTQGGSGATVVTNEDVFNIQPQILNEVVDTVGAGDAFCSVLLLGLYQKWELQEIMLSTIITILVVSVQ